MELGQAALKAVLSAAAKSIMLIGGADAGKTTLAEGLADLLSKKGRVGILDLDMGQSHIGPPATLGWGLLEGGFRSWEKINAQEFYFTGALSPPGNMLPSITGAKLLMESALKRCPKLIIDTTGLISGPLGRLYKQYKIDLLRPDLILAVQTGDELEHIIGPYAIMKRPRIMKLKTSPLARAKGVPLRAEHRSEMFRAYFEGSRVFEIDLNRFGVRYTRDDDGELEGRLVSFRDSFGRDICLGLIEKAKPDERLLVVRSPLKAGTGYACIIIGRVTAGA